MKTLLQDVRYGLRMLPKAPGFAAITVLTLALGMGVNTVVLSILNTLFLRPAPVSNPGKLVMTEDIRRGISPSEYFFQRDHSHTFSSLVAEYVTAHMFLVSGSDSKMVLGAIVSSNYFDLLGKKPLLGRYFVKEEDSPTGQAAVAVLSYGLWKSNFGSDSSIVGKTVALNGVSTTIVGVAPVDFHGLHAGIDNDLWVPTSGASVVAHAGGCEPPIADCGFFSSLIGRLQPNTEIGGAQAELKQLNHQWEGVRPQLRKVEFQLTPVRGLYPGSAARDGVLPAAKLLPLSVVVLLLIACVNVAGLLLARGTARTKEIAVRLALGASRSRIIRQLLTESAILAFLGSALGLLLLEASKNWLSRFPFVGSEGFKSYYDVSLNPFVLASTVFMSAVTVLVFGLVPAFKASGAAPGEALKSTDSTYSPRSRWRTALVAGQVALAFVLLAEATLLVRSLDRILIGPGFDAGHIAIVRVSPFRLGYGAAESEKVQREALRRVTAIPGVKSASLGQLMPWWESGDNWIALPGREPSRKEDRVWVTYNAIAPNYLRTLQVPILRGREFTDLDGKGAPRVVVVNQTLAERMWPAGEAVGETLMIGGVSHAVVGVARNAQYNSASVGPHPFFYLSYWQVRDGGDARFLVRTEAEPGSLLRQIQTRIHDVDRAVPMGEEGTMTEGLLSDFGPLRLTRVVLIFAGVAACFLSAIGLYGILAFIVERRTREIGIRMALGATREGILGKFWRQGMLVAFAGGAAGLLATRLSVRLLGAMLYGVSPTDPLVLAGVGLVLLTACLLASYLPARRATQVDPMVALRHE
jgi:macrolide transport system ATP-binding/permease protein